MSEVQTAAAAAPQFPTPPASTVPAPGAKPSARAFQFTRSQIRPAQATRNIHRCAPPEGVAFEDVLKPAAWIAGIPTINPGDKIEVMPVDERYYAELLVVGKGRADLYVEVLLYKPLNAGADVTAPADSVYEARRVGFGKWGVVRRADRVVMAENLPTKVAALAWIAAHQA